MFKTHAVRFNCVGYIDRRTADLHRRYYDIIEARRAVEQRRQIQMVRSMAALGTDGQGDSTGTSRAAGIWPATARAPFRVVRLR